MDPHRADQILELLLVHSLPRLVRVHADAIEFYLDPTALFDLLSAGNECALSLYRVPFAPNSIPP